MREMKTNLLAGEFILMTTRTHGAIFIIPLFWLVLAGFVYQHFSQVIFSLAPLLLAIGSGINRGIAFYCSNYTLTNLRLLVRQGLIHSMSIQIPLARLESIQIDQSLLGKLFQYANLIIIGMGGSNETLLCLKDPLVFAQRAQEQIEKQRQANEQ